MMSSSFTAAVQPLNHMYITLPQSPPCDLPGPPTFGEASLAASRLVPPTAVHHGSYGNGDYLGPPFGRHQHKRRVQFVGAQVVAYLSLGSSMSPQERSEIWYPTKELDDFRNEARTLCRKLRGPSDSTLSPEASPPARRNAVSPPPPEGLDADVPADPVARVPGIGCASQLTDPEVRNRAEKVADCIVNTMASNKACTDGKLQECSKQLEDDEECEDIDLTDTRGLEHRVCLTRQRNKHLAIRCTLKAQLKSRCPYFISRISCKCTQWAKDLARAEANRDYCQVYCPDMLDSAPKTVNICPFPMSAFKKRDCNGTVVEANGDSNEQKASPDSQRCVRQKTCS